MLQAHFFDFFSKTLDQKRQFSIVLKENNGEPSPGGGGTPLYGLYRYVRPQRVWFFSRFGHK